jgi:uncharacterized phage protein (TIGR01671 family)
MRSIEFRAWDKQSKQMFQVYRIDFREDGLYVNLDTPSRVTELREDWLFGDRLELMQFTGLLDKNGTKVFEGDLCQAGSGIAKVIYDGFGVPCFVSGVNCLSTTEIAVRGVKFEVIGNIHETKN